MMRKELASVLVALSFLLLTACGGGDPAPPPPVNRAPVANAGPDTSGVRGAVITLDATASTDPDGDVLAYKWTQTAGPAVVLSSDTAAKPVFTAPAASGVLDFSLTVSDGKTSSAADALQITIQNRSPVANAGPDASVVAGELYTLDGLASSDPDTDNLTYEWVQLTGVPVTLTTVGVGRARFLTPATSGRIEFGLTVTDGEARSTQDVVAISVTPGAPPNVRPVAETYGDMTVPKRANVSVDGYGYDPDGGTITYRWKQVAGPTVTLLGTTTPQISFVAPGIPAQLQFELLANDGQIDSLPELVTVTVQNNAPTVVGVTLSPTAPHTLDDLGVSVVLDDPDQDAVSLSYVWKRNGAVVPLQTTNTFPATLTSRNDVIVAVVTATDGVLNTSVEASATILDSLPTLVATPPITANFGDQVSFNITATDLDGDAIGSYVVRYGPAGLTVSNTGQVGWRAQSLMFDQNIDIHWSIGLQDHPAAELTGTIRVTDANRQLPLMRSGIVVPQNREQIVVSDLDGNGIADILLTNGQILAEMSKIGSDYEQVWVYPFKPGDPQGGIDSIAAADVAGGAQREIFIAAGSRIVQLSGTDRRVAREYTLDLQQSGTCTALRIADLDQNGSKELICRRGTQSYGGSSAVLVMDAATLTLQWSVPINASGGSLAVGNVDGDAALEIVTAEGYVYDGATHANEWLYGPGFGTTVDVGDLDGDGIGEIAGISGWSLVKIFSAVSRSPIAQLDPASSGGIAELRVANVGGDARTEIILGDAQWGEVKAFSYNSANATFPPVFNINAQDHGVSALAVGNIDADPALELVWGTGVSHSGQDKLIVAQYDTTITVDWNSAVNGQVDGPYTGGLLARTAPGVRRLMFLSPRTLSGYGGSKLFALDPVTGRTSLSPEIATNWAGAASIDVADYDLGTTDEILLASADLYTPFLVAYDFGAASIKWQSPQNFPQGISITHGDFTGDGSPEMVTIGGTGQISIVDVLHSSVVWQSTNLDNNGVDVAVKDLDNDGQLDIVALTGSHLYVYGRSTNSGPLTERRNTAIAGGVDLMVADTNGDGQEELLVLGNFTSQAGLRIYDTSLHLLRTSALEYSGVAMEIEPGTAARKNVLVATGTDSYYYGYSSTSEIRAVDPYTGSIVWRSPAMPGTFSKNSLHAVDVNSDGTSELSYGTSVGGGVTR